MVRLAPLPPKVRLLKGTREVSDDDADKPRLPAGVSSSPITNGIGAFVTFCSTIWLGIDVMVGTSFTELTRTPNVRVIRLFSVWPSLTVTMMVAEPAAPPTG